jgi:hypothetical protein
VSGREWSAHAAANAKLAAATASLYEAHHGPVAAAAAAANSGFVRAQETNREVLTSAGVEYVAVRDAKHAMKAARSGLKAATAVSRLSPEELAAASQDLATLLAQIQRQQAALAAAAGVDAAATSDAAAAAAAAAAGAHGIAAAAAVADAGSPLVRFENIQVGLNLAPSQGPVLLGVSYNGAVGSGEQQQMLMGQFQVDASDSSSEELGLTLADVLRNDVLSALKTRHRSLSALM